MSAIAWVGDLARIVRVPTERRTVSLPSFYVPGIADVGYAQFSTSEGYRVRIAEASHHSESRLWVLLRKHGSNKDGAALLGLGESYQLARSLSSFLLGDSVRESLQGHCGEILQLESRGTELHVSVKGGRMPRNGAEVILARPWVVRMYDGIETYHLAVQSRKILSA